MGINDRNFTGKKGGKKIRRGGKGSKKKRPDHESKYAHLAPDKSKPYNWENKTSRQLPLRGEVGTVFEKGVRIKFHGRMYELTETVEITGSLGEAFGKFRLVK